jgi:hypothetical protein
MEVTDLLGFPLRDFSRSKKFPKLESEESGSADRGGAGRKVL